MAGITVNGFEKKRTDEIKDELDAAVKAVYGPNIDLSVETPDGQFNQSLAESYGNLWDIQEASYFAFVLAAATGVVLDNLVALANIFRLEASPSLVTIRCFGTDTTVIPAGSIVESTSGNQFQTLASGTIGSITTGEVDIDAEALITGNILASTGTITIIITPVTNWTSVTNPADAVPGRDEETDGELRIRYAESTSISSQAQIEAIRAAVQQVDGVSSASVTENASSVPVGGIPAHAFETVVLGGADADIAQVLFEKKPIGIEAYGTTIEVVTDSEGNNYNIGFTRPTPVPIYVIVNLTIDANYPADGDDQIKDNIETYGPANFGTGDDVFQSRLYTPVNEVDGHTVDSLYIGIAPAPASENDISIAVNEISSWDILNITVNS